MIYNPSCFGGNLNRSWRSETRIWCATLISWYHLHAMKTWYSFSMLPLSQSVQTLSCLLTPFHLPSSTSKWCEQNPCLRMLTSCSSWRLGNMRRMIYLESRALLALDLSSMKRRPQGEEGLEVLQSTPRTIFNTWHLLSMKIQASNSWWWDYILEVLHHF